MIRPQIWEMGARNKIQKRDSGSEQDSSEAAECSEINMHAVKVEPWVG